MWALKWLVRVRATVKKNFGKLTPQQIISFAMPPIGLVPFEIRFPPWEFAPENSYLESALNFSCFVTNVLACVTATILRRCYMFCLNLVMPKENPLQQVKQTLTLGLTDTSATIKSLPLKPRQPMLQSWG